MDKDLPQRRRIWRWRESQDHKSKPLTGGAPNGSRHSVGEAIGIATRVYTRKKPADVNHSKEVMQEENGTVAATKPSSFHMLFCATEAFIASPNALTMDKLCLVHVLVNNIVRIANDYIYRHNPDIDHEKERIFCCTLCFEITSATQYLKRLYVVLSEQKKTWHQAVPQFLNFLVHAITVVFPSFIERAKVHVMRHVNQNIQKLCNKYLHKNLFCSPETRRSRNNSSTLVAFSLSDLILNELVYPFLNTAQVIQGSFKLNIKQTSVTTSSLLIGNGDSNIDNDNSTDTCICMLASTVISTSMGTLLSYILSHRFRFNEKGVYFLFNTTLELQKGVKVCKQRFGLTEQQRLLLNEDLHHWYRADAILQILQRSYVLGQHSIRTSPNSEAREGGSRGSGGMFIKLVRLSEEEIKAWSRLCRQEYSIVSALRCILSCSVLGNTSRTKSDATVFILMNTVDNIHTL